MNIRSSVLGAVLCVSSCVSVTSNEVDYAFPRDFEVQQTIVITEAGRRLVLLAQLVRQAGERYDLVLLESYFGRPLIKLHDEAGKLDIKWFDLPDEIKKSIAVEDLWRMVKGLYESRRFQEDNAEKKSLRLDHAGSGSFLLGRFDPAQNCRFPREIELDLAGDRHITVTTEKLQCPTDVR